MSAETIAIPQADSLWDVARVPMLIHAGATTPQEVGNLLGPKVLRQGFYYIHAARLLGLVAETAPGEPLSLTPLGRLFAQSDALTQRRTLRRLVRQREPMAAVLELLHPAAGASREEIAALLEGLAPLARSTALRRGQTIAAWLVELDLAAWRGGRLYRLEAPPTPSVAATPRVSLGH